MYFNVFNILNVFLYTIMALSHVNRIVVSNEDTFKNVVVDFQNKHGLISAIIEDTMIEHTDYFYGVPEELISFENDLILILQQITYLFYFKKTTINIHLPGYVLKVCSVLWRFLDYIYTYALVNRKIILLSKMHFVICYKLPPYFNGNINAYPDGVVMDRFIETLKTDLSKLQNSAKQETLIKNDFFNLHEDQEFIRHNEEFIANVFNLVGIIGKNPSMVQSTNNLFYNIFQDCSSQHNGVSMRYFRLSNNDKIADEKLKNLTKIFIDNFKNSCGLSSSEIQDIDTSASTADVIYKLLLYVLKNLEYFILYSNDNDSKATKEDTTITDHEVSIMINEMCKYIPLIILYLNYNKMYNISYWNMMSLYLTICSDFKEYTDFRCSNLFYGIAVDDIISEANMICERESVKNIQAWSFFMITDKQAIKDKFVKKTCIKSNYDFIKENFELVQLFYKGLTVGVWTTVEWLNGKYFLTENYSNDDMNELKFKEIIVRGVTMTLSEAYYLTFPWRTNIHAALAFHHTIVNHLNTMMSMHVYRHAYVIILYLKSIKCRAEETVLKRIRDSVLWHSSGTKMFYKYLFLPKVIINTTEDNTNIIIEDHTEEYQNVNDIITTISKLESIHLTNITTDCESTIDKLIRIPEDAKEELSKWSKTEYIDTANGHNRFDLVMAFNCDNAMDFISTFYLIVNKSMGISIDSIAKDITKCTYSKNVFRVQPSDNSLSVVYSNPEILIEPDNKDSPTR
ncbi:Hypothetical protein CINCED_3A007169 [Cinara cedri]|uniref:Uncharacterized protein n=1 Tax=Cinara cedri TaxID=506608 RepID=A0A5E4M7A5_9HEMI|nr:Hypothetical protein CINCED_3A007169 [Cinara cedri]